MDTRTQLIEVAERLFAERGINGVSLREIGAEAGQRNTGAARYHFGSKDGLVDAVFRHRMEPINERRLGMLAALDHGHAEDVRGLLEAFVYPLAEIGRPSWYLRFLVQAAFVETADARQVGQPWMRGMEELRQRFEAALRAQGLPADAVGDRVLFVFGFVVHALADREQATRASSPDDAFLAHLVDAAVALTTAPLTQHRQHRRSA